MYDSRFSAPELALDRTVDLVRLMVNLVPLLDRALVEADRFEETVEGEGLGGHCMDGSAVSS